MSTNTFENAKMDVSEEHLGMRYLTPYHQGNLKGWLVKFNYATSGKKKKTHSKLFKFDGVKSEKEVIEEAKQYRFQWLTDNPDKVTVRPWRTAGRGLSTELQANNRSGIPGVSRRTEVLPSGTVSESWSVSFNTVEGRSKATSFAIRRHGEIGALKKAIQIRKTFVDSMMRTKEHSEDLGALELYYLYEDLLSNLDELEEDQTEKSVIDITRDPNVSATTKLEQIKARVGQQRFRREVIGYFEQACAVTQSSILIRASHIKPWKVANDVERIDPNNGLALSPSYDLAFDQGYISFNPTGEILISAEHKNDLLLLGVSKDAKLRRVSAEHMVYLDWHRKNVYNKLQKS